MIADQERRSMPKWGWLNDWRSLIAPEFGLLVLFLLLIATILAISSTDSAGSLHATKLSLTDLEPHDQPLELKGSLRADSQQGQITALHFVIALAPEAPPFDLTAPHLTMRYQDATQQIDKVPWSWRFQNARNDNSLLEVGERVELTISLHASLTPMLGVNTPFRVELAAPQRLLFSVQRLTPPVLTPRLELN